MRVGLGGHAVRSSLPDDLSDARHGWATARPARAGAARRWYDGGHVDRTHHGRAARRRLRLGAVNARIEVRPPITRVPAVWKPRPSIDMRRPLRSRYWHGAGNVTGGEIYVSREKAKLAVTPKPRSAGSLDVRFGQKLRARRRYCQCAWDSVPANSEIRKWHQPH
jgi:hypothetical protein